MIDAHNCNAVQINLQIWFPVHLKSRFIKTMLGKYPEQPKFFLCGLNDTFVFIQRVRVLMFVFAYVRLRKSCLTSLKFTLLDLLFDSSAILLLAMQGLSDVFTTSTTLKFKRIKQSISTWQFSYFEEWL